MKYIKIIIILIISLLLTGCTGVPASKDNLAMEDVENLDEDYFYDIIKGAVEYNGWLYAGSKDEIKRELLKYYTEPLAEELSQQAWEFVQLQTDWYSEVSLNSLSIVSTTTDRIVMEAELLDMDIITGEKQIGRGIFSLINTRQGWRIFTAEYSWK